MASNIIFNTIDEAYPVAGVDNNTQGFRDNFSVIKTGLQTANAEIDALQTNAIVKGPLTSGGAVDNDFAGVKISDAVLNQVTEKYFTLSDVQTSQEINFSNGHMQSIRYTGNDSSVTFTLSGFPSATDADGDGRVAKMTVLFFGPNNDPSVSDITVNLTALGGASFKKSSNFPSMFTISDLNNPVIVEFWSYDGGNSIIYANYLGKFE